MGQLVNASLEQIEDFLESVRYGDLEMDEVNDILLRLTKAVRLAENIANRAENIASCIANGIQLD